jgi:hypothetical protein
MVRAVLTGDLESSTHMTADELEAVIRAIKHEAVLLKKAGYVSDLEFYRGDSFQVLVLQPEMALRAALVLKTSVNRMLPPGAKQKNRRKVVYDTAISIGLGEVSKEQPVRVQNEKPHILSGKGLDQLKEQHLTLGLFTGHEENDKTYIAMLTLVNWLMKQWSVNSAELVYYKLKQKTEQEISEILDISQSAVNQRSNVACWHGIDRLLNHYQTIGVHKYA